MGAHTCYNQASYVKAFNMNIQTKGTALLLLAIMAYSQESFAAGRGCGPEGCGFLGGLIAVGAVVFWLYLLARGRTIPWLGLIPHILVIGGIAFAASAARGFGAAVAALAIMIVIIHAGITMSGAKKK